MNKSKNITRRRFVQGTAGAAAAAVAAPMIVPASVFGQNGSSPNDRIVIGFIGVGSRGTAHVNGLTGRPNVLAVAACDVDADHMARAKKIIDGKNTKLGRPSGCATYPHYEDVLARKDIDAVVITTPDHWHVRIAIAALKAGKDVYCEKPLTLTIDEGKMLTQVVRDTKRVFQVGTQQRSAKQFLEAVALARNGLLGKIRKVTCAIGGGPKGGPFKKEAPPATLDWERWQGQTPLVDYIKERCHYQFRWWYEYSGGKMTDWGAHHVDIAQWGIKMEHSGPLTVEPVVAEHPVPFKHGRPTVDDQYNTATAFKIKCMFAGDIELEIRHDGENGITFEGEDGTIFVNRGKRTGKFQKDSPLTEDDLTKLYKGPRSDHYGNWLRCIKDRGEPVSDVFSHHRHLSTCHLANIAARLGRKIKWDPAEQQIIGDDEANGWLKRQQRKGYEIKV